MLPPVAAYIAFILILIIGIRVGPIKKENKNKVTIGSILISTISAYVYTQYYTTRVNIPVESQLIPGAPLSNVSSRASLLSDF